MQAGKQGTSVLGEELRALCRLALPLMASQIRIMLLGVMETLIVGRAGTQALAAVSLENARRAAHLSLLLGSGVMAFFGAILFLLRWQFPRLYGAEPAVAALCAQVLPVAAAFQILDGTQVVAGGILRGLGGPDRLRFSTLVVTISWPSH